MPSAGRACPASQDPLPSLPDAARSTWIIPSPSRSSMIMRPLLRRRLTQTPMSHSRMRRSVLSARPRRPRPSHQQLRCPVPLCRFGLRPDVTSSIACGIDLEDQVASMSFGMNTGQEQVAVLSGRWLTRVSLCSVGPWYSVAPTDRHVLAKSLEQRMSTPSRGVQHQMVEPASSGADGGTAAQVHDVRRRLARAGDRTSTRRGSCASRSTSCQRRSVAGPRAQRFHPSAVHQLPGAAAPPFRPGARRRSGPTVSKPKMGLDRLRRQRARHAAAAWGPAAVSESRAAPCAPGQLAVRGAITPARKPSRPVRQVKAGGSRQWRSSADDAAIPGPRGGSGPRRDQRARPGCSPRETESFSMPSTSFPSMPYYEDQVHGAVGLSSPCRRRGKGERRRRRWRTGLEDGPGAIAADVLRLSEGCRLRTLEQQFIPTPHNHFSPSCSVSSMQLIHPGQTQLTRTVGAYSMAAVFVRPTTPCLLAA